MKLNLLLFFTFLSGQLLLAQTFTESVQVPSLEGVDGSIAFADIDGDNDQDLLITGFSGLLEPVSKLYTNDGFGHFTEVLGTPFDNIHYSSIAFADVDGDNDQDVFIVGETSTGRISKLYTNDGLGNFTEVTGTSFDAVIFSAIAFADVDGDNDQDLFITGGSTSGSKISKLYTNDGLGNFTEMTNTPFAGVQFSAIAFADIDGDNDQDVLITGEADSGSKISKLYTNDSLGNFTEVTGTPFIGVWSGAVAFADVDGDNDQDLLIVGQYSIGIQNKKSALYTNDGLGNFTEVMGTPFIGIAIGDIAFADIDGDHDQDLLITGSSPSGMISKLYANDSLGNFTEIVNIPFDGVTYSSVAFSDVDGDTDQDLLITGQTSSSDLIAKLYTNDNIIISNPCFPPYGLNALSTTDTSAILTWFVPINTITDFTIRYKDVMDTVWVTTMVSDTILSLNIGSLMPCTNYEFQVEMDCDTSISGFSQSFIFLTDSCAVSSKEILNPLNFDFMLYPNPTKGNKVNVNLNSKRNRGVSIKIFDITGRLLQEDKKEVITGEITFSIDISSLNKGVYIIQLDDGLRKGMRKLIVH